MSGWMAGRVWVNAKGPHVERFINLCAQRGVVLSSASRVGLRSMAFCVDVNTFYLLRPIARSAGVRLRINKRSGMPFLRVFFRRRFMLPIGALLCVMVLIALSGRVWGINILCEQVALGHKAQQALYESGVHIGVQRAALDLLEIRQRIEKQLPEASFVGLRQRGVLLEMEVVPRYPEPQMIDRQTPCDIVARCDGVIVEITAMQGRALVKPGDAVVSGQVLIEGYSDILGDVHAMGMVTARTGVYGMGKAPLYEKQYDLTGRSMARRSIEAAGYVFYDAQVPFTEYTQTHVSTSYLLDGLFFPVRSVVTQYNEAIGVWTKRDSASVQQEAYLKALGEAVKVLPPKMSVVDKRIESCKIENGSVVVNLNIEAEVSMGVEKARPAFYTPMPSN